MKKALFASIAIVALSIPSFAGVAAKPSKTVVAPPECFRAGELQLDAFGSYNNSTGGANNGHGFGGGLGLNYFITRNLGVGVEGNVWSPNHTIWNPNANIIWRFPLEFSGHCLAPYIFGGGGGTFDGSNAGEGHVGGGLEYRATPKIGIFSDYRHAWGGSDFNTIRAGLRFVF